MGNLETDTIAAISTPPGTGGISCIRISGSRAFEIASKVFIGKKNFNDIKSHSIAYGKVINKDSEILDEVILLKMKKPGTYTREDVVEIQCHGGTVVTGNILELLFKNGVVPAQPGEFTKRAFMNGRIDLSQAEAVMDVINSKTQKSEKSAVMQLEGKTGSRIKEIKSRVVYLLSHIGVSIDYPEYEDEDISLSEALKETQLIKVDLENTIKNFDTGRILREGLNIAVIGPPNAGKSTFINKVTGEERAIVTHIPGTTRDVLEIQFSLKGYPVILHDTAGIRRTDDFIEKIGIEKSYKIREKSEIIVLVLDAVRGLDEVTKSLIDNADDRETVFAINKTDQDSGKELSEYIGEDRTVKCCLLEDEGTDDILEKVYSHIEKGEIEISDMTVTNARHKAHVDFALLALDKAIETGSCSGFLDLMAVDLTAAANELGKITGENTGEDIIRTIFSQFCVGK